MNSKYQLLEYQNWSLTNILILAFILRHDFYFKVFELRSLIITIPCHCQEFDTLLFFLEFIQSLYDTFNCSYN